MQSITFCGRVGVHTIAEEASTNLGLMADALMQLLNESGFSVPDDSVMECKIRATRTPDTRVNVSISLRGDEIVVPDTLKFTS